MKKSSLIKSFIVTFVLIVFLGNTTLICKNNEKLFRLSAGYGVPYGYMGINFEVNPLLPENLIHLNNYFSFSLGMGYREGKPLLALGINGYPLGRKGLFQPRLSFYYAKVDRILDVYNTYEEDFDTIEALCLGTGIVFQVSDTLSINTDVFYLAHIYDDLYIDTDHTRIKFAIGGQFHFKSLYTEQTTETSFLNAGVGIGIPYGVIGINIELNPLLPGSIGKAIHSYFSISIGSGFTNAGSSYSIGARIYPMQKDGKFIPRLGVYHGTVAVYNWSYSATNLEGYAFSVGTLYNINAHLALDFDFIYIAEVFGWEMSELNASRFKVSFGVRYKLIN